MTKKDSVIVAFREQSINLQDKNIAARIKLIRHRFTQVANIPSFEITILTISSKAIENNGAIKIESSRQNRIMRESTKPGTSKRSKRNSEDIKKGIHINKLPA